MKKKLIVLIIFGILLLSIVGVFAGVGNGKDSKSRLTDYDWMTDKINKSFEKGNSLKEFNKDEGKYGKVYITNNGNDLKDLELKNNTFTCGQDCYSITDIILYEDTELVSDVIFEKLLDDGTWINSSIRNYQLYVYTEGKSKKVYDYDWVGNGTFYNITNSSGNYTFEHKEYVKVGHHKETLGEWTRYEKGMIAKGDKKGEIYTIKLEGEKRPEWTYDWKFVTEGEIINEYAVWGNISLGDDAEVILNRPENNSVSINNPEIFNCSATITGGATLTNMSLWGNFNGTWLINETSFFSTFSPINVANSYNMDGGNSAWINKAGIKILTKVPLAVINITKHPSVTSTKAYILNSSFDILGTATFSGNTATFGEVINLNNNTYYYLVSDKEGGTYQMQRDTATTSESETYFNWEKGVSGTLESSVDFYNILQVGIQGSIYPNTAIQTKIFNKTISQDTNWTCSAGDSDGVTGFATENRTILLNQPPQITINSPSASVTSKEILVNVSVTDDLSNVSYCEFNITRGASTEVANTELNISDYNSLNSSLNLSSEADYILNVFCNDSIGNENVTSKSFTYAIPVVPVTPSGGGGGTTVVIGQTNETRWSMTTQEGGDNFQITTSPGIKRSTSLRFENLGTSSRTIKLTCKDSIGSLCKYLSFENSEITLPLAEGLTTFNKVTLDLPQEVVVGTYALIITGTDDLTQTGQLTMNVTVKNDFLSLIISKLFSNALYWLLFIGSWIFIGITLSTFAFKDNKYKGAISGSLGFLIAFLLVYLL